MEIRMARGLIIFRLDEESFVMNSTFAGAKSL
jgi:hypothetical protein